MLHSFGTHEVNTDTREVRHEGELIATEPQVFDVLCFLIEHRDRVVTKEELLDGVWGDRFVSESALSSRIKDARRALGDDGQRQAMIKTMHGRGFRFVGPNVVTSGRPSTGTAGSIDGPAAPTGPRRQLALSVDREFAFVGREGPLDLARRLVDASAERTQVLMLGGEPGIGKSRLATEIAERQSSAGMLGLGGRCDRHLATSLQPWVESLTPYVLEADVDVLAGDTSGVLEHLRPVMPALDARMGGGVPPSARADDYAAIDALSTLVERISLRQPLVIVLDDVQWAGGATRALTSLIQRTGSARVLIVLTFRTTLGDLDEAAAEWLDGLVRAGASRVDLEPLHQADVETLVDEVLGDESGAAARSDVWTRSEGHSLFAVELLRSLRSDGDSSGGLPDTVASLVRSRFTKLRAEVSLLVGAGAAIGPQFELGLAAAAGGLDESRALDAIDEALSAQLVHEIDDRPDWYRFSHQLVPASALEAMSTSRRVRLHARLVDELTTRNAPAAQIAHHLLEASPVLDLDDVVDRVRATATALLTDHQYDRAVELLQRLSRLDLEPRTHAEVLAEYGDACNRAGLQPRALEPFGQTAALARRHGWDDLLAVAALGLWGQSPFRASQDRTVIPLVDEAIQRSAALGDQTRARLLAKRAAFNLFSGPMVERDAMSAEAVALVGEATSHARLEVLEARWMALASPSRIRECVDIDVELTRLRKELAALTTDACAPEIMIYNRGDGAELRAIADELAADPRQRRDVDQWRTTALAGTFALFEGDLEAARRLTEQALPLGSEPWGESGEVVHGLVHLIIDAVDGDLGRSLDRWRAIAHAVPSDAMRATQSWVEAIAGDLAVARQLVDRVRPRLTLLAENFMGGMGLVGLTNAVAELEDGDYLAEIDAVLAPIDDLMLGHPWAPSYAAAHLRTRIAQALNSPDIDAHRANAVAIYERLGAPSLIELLD